MAYGILWSKNGSKKGNAAMKCPHCNDKNAKIVKRRWPDGRPDDWMCQACGRAVKNYQPEIFTSEASEIGRLYRQAKSNFVDSVKLLIECGERLKAQKGKLSHGEWLPWVEANRGKLGFGLSTADKLMRGANSPLTTNLTEAQAVTISRQIWGNREPEPSKPHSANAALTHHLSETQKPSPDWEESPDDPDPEPKEKKPPSFLKPVIDIPQPKKLDANPRQCRATCCPAGSEITGPWGRHDAQLLLDEKGFPSGFFGKHHAALLDVLVEVDQRRLVAQLGGLQRSAMVPERYTRFKGIGQGRN
jgi:hypothetical protein